MVLVLLPFQCCFSLLCRHCRLKVVWSKFFAKQITFFFVHFCLIYRYMQSRRKNRSLFTSENTGLFSLFLILKLLDDNLALRLIEMARLTNGTRTLKCIVYSIKVQTTIIYVQKSSLLCFFFIEEQKTIEENRAHFFCTAAKQHQE